ncbi:hypothetical protein [Corynebacterium auris]|uniref:hypothetical protein n=1 Tax=Corynebacterium auris TaxID=44750 RepID=UPI0025B5C38D|nr:hypothetical protein [Corynebacterium auris]WJY67043.1 hypothetical protein CAURIS_00475 [Corynebacterium auris]
MSTTPSNKNDRRNTKNTETDKVQDQKGQDQKGQDQKGTLDQDELVDEQIDQSFPASDPPASY